MKTAVIAPLGLSPPVITAGMDSSDFSVTDLVIIATQDRRVLAGLDLIKVGMSIHTPHIHIHSEILPFDDVSSTDENFVVMECAKKIILRERAEHGCNRVLLNVAGGRKNMCVTLALVGQLMNADGVFHIVNKEISLFNQGLERMRSEIMKIYEAPSFEEKQAIYRENEERFRHLLYPPRSAYEIVRLPTFPIERTFMGDLIRVLADEDLDLLPLSLQEILERHGILEKGKTHYYLSDYGRRFIDAFL
ncbi:MAG: CRISPR-associated protein (Cas_NE0113) [Methanoregulaceae archaeon PtaB.Bin009]|nr:MAG: CRISPR-associated protein (Cas_NE0113) [Methanoregulaceae archaeon PtaB.Bin009]OPY45389.1 MAG: CRISPR-associated protein (Cas_NE0113) [Methanoregulaceae archaeon PtaU1.Bin222]